MVTLGDFRACCSFADTPRIRAVFHVMLPIGGNRTKVEVSQMPPTFQHDPSIEWLAFGGHDDAIVLAPCVWIIFAPTQLEALKVQFIESEKQVLRPLVAVTAFPQAVINEKIIEDWRAKHAVFSSELAYSDERAFGQQLCFVTIYSR